MRPDDGADGKCEQRKCELEAVLLHFIWEQAAADRTSIPLDPEEVNGVTGST